MSNRRGEPALASIHVCRARQPRRDARVLVVAWTDQAAAEVDAGNYSRSWAAPRYRTGFGKTSFETATSRPNKLKDWFTVRWPRALSTG